MQKKDKVLVRINIAQSSYEANAFPCLAVLHHPKTQMKEGRFPHSFTRPSMIQCTISSLLDSLNLASSKDSDEGGQISALHHPSFNDTLCECSWPRHSATKFVPFSPRKMLQVLRLVLYIAARRVILFPQNSGGTGPSLVNYSWHTVVKMSHLMPKHT